MNQDPAGTSGQSVSTADRPAPPERRADGRIVRLLRVGVMVVDGRRELCLIRNISSGGMMIRAYSAIAVGTPITVELRQGEPVTGTVQWAHDDSTGVGFDEPIDILALLARDATGPSPRLPRIELECGGWVRQQARQVRAIAINISQGGLCVRSPRPLDVGGHVVVSLPGLTPAAGVVRWTLADCYGIGFNRPMLLSELAYWLKERRAGNPGQIAI